MRRRREASFSASSCFDSITSSAAADGVGARRSATKSQMVKSVSWPTGPSITPGVYFRTLLLGYFEGIDSERGIAWRLADSLSMRRFIAYALTEATPDHSSISRTRRLFAVETHTAVFRW